ncbi:hypothetical protein ACW9KT_21990 [Hymenobacter sp. HD11105]
MSATAHARQHPQRPAVAERTRAACCPFPADSSKTLLVRLVQRVRAERQANRGKARRVHRYFNPLRVVYQVVGL